MPIAESEKIVRTADLKARMKQFALRVMKLIDALLAGAVGLVAIRAASRKSALGNRKLAVR
jgi:hypothetical protein